MLVAVIIAVVLVCSIATWTLVVSSLRRLHSIDSRTARPVTTRQIRVLAVLGLAGFVLTFAGYTILLDLLGVADDSTGGFFLFFLVFIVSVAPCMALAAMYGRRRQADGAAHQGHEGAPQ